MHERLQSGPRKNLEIKHSRQHSLKSDKTEREFSLEDEASNERPLTDRFRNYPTMITEPSANQLEKSAHCSENPQDSL